MGQKGYRWHKVAFGAHMVLGAIRGIGELGCRGVRGCRVSWMHWDGNGKWTGTQPHWAPVQGPSTSTGFPWGMTYLTKARQGSLLRVPSLPLVSLGE